MLARKQLVVTGNSDGVVKQCAECGEDVAHDMFRTKSEHGYLCAECEDEALDRAWHARQRRQKWIRAIFLILVFGTVLFGVMSTATTLMDHKGPIKKP